MKTSLSLPDTPWAWLGRRYARFCLVGGSGLFVDMAVLWLLAGSEARGWHLVISKALAAEAAILNNFLWNDRWTFRDAEAEVNRRGSRWGRFGWFNLICLAGIGWSVVLLQLQAGWLGMNVYLANLVSIVAVSAWNFGMNLKFGWRMAPSHRSRGTDPEGSGF